MAGNTDPDVVGALVELCYEAGAKKVKVFDGPCNEEKRVYAASGIADAAKLKGADVFFANSWNVAKAHFPYESPLEGWPIYRDAIECDVFINVPILKHHRLTRLTISMKNLMGVCSGDRGRIHADIGEKLADLAFFIKPDLTVIDATRVLFRNGPSGGDLADVERRDTIIVATDLVLADTFAAGFVDVNPLQVPNIKPGSDKGLGSMDLAGADIVRLGSA
ncbi:MAG: DUF362 domain-containing protein [Candidatus Omnitrophica bacterium]|nr:DUF362 domain-containing protein [Candidatus Omnitrophota bacterium]